MEINEGNRLIAEFMGKDYSDVDEREGMPDSLRYHTSYGWLMPVVEFISTIDSGRFGVMIDTAAGVEISDYKHSVGIPIVTIDISNRLTVNDIFEAVTEFIQWHNKQQEG